MVQNVNNGSLSCHLIDMMIVWLFFNIQGLMSNDSTAVVTGTTERWQMKTCDDRKVVGGFSKYGGLR